MNRYYLSKLVFKVKDFVNLLFLYFSVSLFIPDPEVWSLVLHLLHFLKILHFLKCVISLSYPAITLSWVKYLVPHLVFLTCFSASEEICQIPLSRCPWQSSNSLHPVSRVSTAPVHLGIPVFYSLPRSEVVLNHAYWKNTVCEKETNVASSANWMC